MASAHLEARKQLAISLAQRAADLIVRQPAASASVRLGPFHAKSSPTDIATSVDHASEQLIVQAIVHYFPDDGIYAEEGSARPSESGFTWIIDPLDGTANYVRGIPVSAVSIALAYNDIVVAGVVVDPYARELFVAAGGKGATRNGQPLDVRSVDGRLREAGLRSSFVGLSGTNRPGPAATRASLFAVLSMQVDSVRDVGSTALSLCWTAAGRFDAHIGIDVAWWDLAAGVIIAREAGCVVSGLSGEDDVSPEGFVVAHPMINDSIIGLVNDSRAQGPA